ncbi:MAG: cobalt-zinc-cadmium efflux system membrane fusion protein [Arcticibacterium sp.]|jgi:cobalt-zinc-cadmium efflux system membrane fusion protein
MKILPNIFNPSFLVLIILTTFSCSEPSIQRKVMAVGPSSKELVLSDLQFKTANLHIGTAGKRTFKESFKARGVLDAAPENKHSVNSYFSGYVKNTSLLTGQKVRVGQVLFTLENPEYLVFQQEFLEAQSMLSYYKNDYDRQKALVAENVSSEKKFLQAKADYEVAAARYASLKQKLKLMHINTDNLSPENLSSTIKVTAPIDGIISAVSISRGMFISPNETALEIINNRDLKLALTIYEKDLSKIELGQEMSFQLAKYPHKVFKAKVDLISPLIDLDKRSVIVHASINKESMEENLSPGTYVEVDIINDSTSLFSLGREALVQKGRRYEALVFEGKVDDQYLFKIIQLEIKASNEDYLGFELPPELKGKQFLLNGTFSLLGE